MFVLIMIVILGNSSLNLTHLYYEDTISCHKAAAEFESHKSKDIKFKAFCIKGDQ